MRLHIIKIHKLYHDRIWDGQKTFEVRKNDRDYQVGDVIDFIDATDEKVLPGPNYKITYVHNGLGMASDYVVLGIIPFRGDLG